jgi:Tfp pilus assembly protein PilN
MTEVNLLPADVRERNKTRRVTVAIGAGAGAAVVLLAFVFVLQSARLAAANRQLALQQSTNQHLQTQIGGLQRYRELKQEVADKHALVAEVTHGDVQWSGVLRDLSMVIPGDVWLSQFQGNVASAATGSTGAPAVAGASAVTAPDIIGSLQVQGYTLDHPSVALWLTRLEQVNGWVNPWVSSSSKSNGEVTFSGSVDLTTQVASGGRQ